MTDQMTTRPTAGEDQVPRFVRIEEAQRRFSIARSTLYRLLHEGQIRSCSLKISGKQSRLRLIDANSVAAFIEGEIERQRTVKEPGPSAKNDNET